MSDLDRRALVALAEARHGVITAAEAAAAGVSRAALRWAVDSKVLVRIRSGAFVPTATWEAASERARHLLLVRATQRLNPSAVACRTSAAIVLGLPVPFIVEPQFEDRAANGRRGGAVFHRSGDGQVYLHRGIRITSPTQTVLDCARSFERAWGLAVADAAIFRGYVTAAGLREASGQLPAHPGITKVLWVAAHAKAKVESPLESLGRAAIVLADLPEPEPQVWFRTRSGWYRVDLANEVNRVVTEADGKVKYDDPQAVWNEKGRQDDLRDLALEVVRFTMADHHNQRPWLAAYRRALVRGSRG